MDIVGRPGADAVAGEEQGYIGLPIRRVRTYDTTLRREVPALETQWMMTAQEMERHKAGVPITLRILGVQHPPVYMEVPPIEQDTSENRFLFEPNQIVTTKIGNRPRRILAAFRDGDGNKLYATEFFGARPDKEFTSVRLFTETNLRLLE